MLRKIKLYGKLAKFIGHRVLEADVATAAEAVRFLLANWPELEAHMSDQHYRVSVGTYDLVAEELHDPAGAAPISFVPVVAGAGGGALKIIVGIALIALSFGIGSIAAGAAFAASSVALSGLSTIAFAVNALAYLGAALILGGVAQLLTPTAKLSQGVDSEGDPRKSYSFSGVQNTSRAGVPVPVVYGETLVGSVVISAGIDIVQVSA
jgi:predicted phage tail protein